MSRRRMILPSVFLALLLGSNCSIASAQAEAEQVESAEIGSIEERLQRLEKTVDEQAKTIEDLRDSASPLGGLQARWRDGLHFVDADRGIDIHIGGRIHADLNYFDQNSRNVTAVGDALRDHRG